MAVSLSGSLAAHQKGPATRPSVRLRVRGIRGGHEVLRWTLKSGAGNSNNRAGALFTSNYLAAVRINGTNVQSARTLNPTPASPALSFSTVNTVISGSDCAIAAKPDGTTTVLYSSANDIKGRDGSAGASWGAEYVMDTYASPCQLAIAYAPNGSGCAFWNEGATLYRKRRATNGVWGTRTAWTNSAASITGIAVAYFAGDYHLIVTGTETTTNRKCTWGTIFGDTNIPTDNWSALRELIWADAGASTAFRHPNLAAITADRLRATVVVAEAGPVAIDRLYELHGQLDAGVNAEWSEPTPHEATNGEAAIAADAGNTHAWLISHDTEWTAPRATSWVDLSTRLTFATFRIGPEYATATIELDDADGAALASGQLFPGGSIELAPGFASGSGGAAEYGAVVSFVVNRVVRAYANARRVLTVHAHGIWEELAAYRQQVSWQVASGTLTRGDVIRRVLGHAGFGLSTDGSQSAQWAGYSPAFTMSDGESGDTAARRLFAVLSDVAIADTTTELRVRGTSPTGATDWSLGAAGQHPIATAEATDEASSPATWVRVVGPGRFADAHDFPAIYQLGNRWRKRGVASYLRAGDLDAIERALEQGERRRHILRDLEASTDTRANEWAAAALRQLAVREEIGRITIPWHAGIQLWDVLSLTSSPLGWSGQLARVLEIGLDFDRRPGRPPRYNARITLAPR